jgi:hypothetical protein
MAIMPQAYQRRAFGFAGAVPRPQLHKFSHLIKGLDHDRFRPSVWRTVMRQSPLHWTVIDC